MTDVQQVPLESDAAKIGKVVANAGQKIELLHEAALIRLREWQKGARASAFGQVGSGLIQCSEHGCEENPNPDSPWSTDWQHTHPRGTQVENAAFNTSAVDGMLGDYQRDIAAAYRAVSRVQDTYRALFPTGDPKQVADPTDWCTHHLNTLGKAAPRYRGNLCRACYEFQLVPPRVLPPREILEAWHDGRRVTQAMIAAAMPKSKRKRKKAG